MIKKIIAIILIASMLIGCQKKETNQYLGDMKSSYHFVLDGKKLPQEVFEFYYGYMISRYINYVGGLTGSDMSGILPFDISKNINDLEKQTCTLEGYKDKTWADYFANEAILMYCEIEGLYNDAIQSGLEITEEMKATAMTQYDSLLTYCKNNEILIDDYLHSLYGHKANEQLMIEYFEKMQLASFYGDTLTQDLSIEEFYNKYSDVIDLYDIYYIYFDKSDEALNKANEMVETIHNGEEFKNYVSKHNIEDIGIHRCNLKDETIPENLKETIYSLKTNEVKMVESENVYEVVLLERRHKPTNYQANVATIYLDARADGTTITEENLKKCEQYAMDIMNHFNTKTDKSLDAFHELNKQYSDVQTNQGDEDQVSRGDTSYEIDQWLFNERRTNGDVAVLKSTYGYSVVFFKSYGKVDYEVKCQEKMKQVQYEEKIKSYIESTNLSVEK